MEFIDQKQPQRPRWLRWPTISTLSSAVTILTAVVGVVTWYFFGRTYGNCDLKPVSHATAERLNRYLQNGIRYGTGQPELAIAQFQQLLIEDPHFLGANLNLGVIYLAQHNLQSAQKALEKELDLIECLKAVMPGDLPRFAYMLTSRWNPLTGGPRTEDYRARLDADEDVAHYNLACLRIKQGDSTGARAELTLAAKNCSISKDQFETDPELAPLRKDPASIASWTHCGLSHPSPSDAERSHS